MIMPGRAVAALHRAGVEERLLERVQLAVASSRPSIVVIALPATAPTRVEAGAGRLAVDQHGAGAAPALAAAVLGAGQVQVVAQDAQQAAVGIGVDAVGLAVDVQLGHTFRHGPLTVPIPGGSRDGGRDHQSTRS